MITYTFLEQGPERGLSRLMDQGVDEQRHGELVQMAVGTSQQLPQTWHEQLLEREDEEAFLLLVGLLQAVGVDDEELQAEEELVEGVDVGDAVELLEK